MSTKTSPGASPIADRMSRTNLLLARRALIMDFDEADAWFAKRPVLVSVGPDAVVSPDGQAAALTATTLLRRAGFPVQVILLGQATVLTGPLSGMSLDSAIASVGGDVVANSKTPTAQITIGNRDPSRSPGQATQLPDLQATWDGWVAAIREAGNRLPEREGCAVAPILAAALAVGELFGHFTGSLEAAWRPVTISLWDPLSDSPLSYVGPLITGLPAAWALVGLGHLGQAYAWCLAHLNYQPGVGEAWLFDDDFAGEANLSTGVMTYPTDLTAGIRGTPRRKTRIVADALEASGRPARMIEHRLPENFRVTAGMPGIALIGVDNLELRRMLSDMGWRLCIDAGLGSTPSSYNSLSLHVFDGSANSSSVAAWRNSGVSEPNLEVPAFDALADKGLDQCGLVMLAGKNVAAAFVGMTAACLTVGEALRRASLGAGSDTLSLSLDALSLRGNSAPEQPWREPVIPAMNKRSMSGM